MITHGHADHARAGHGHVIATQETLSIMDVRYGKNHADATTPMSIGETVKLGDGNDTVVAFGENQAHQTDKITLSGTVETGDVYTVTINATKASYRVQDGDTMSDVQSGLINVLNAGASDTIVVTAGTTSDEIIVRANRTGMQEEFQVNSTTYHEQTNPSATTLADGSVIVTWQSQYQDYSSTWGVFGQRFDVSGKALGEEFRINAYTNSCLLYTSPSPRD